MIFKLFQQKRFFVLFRGIAVVLSAAHLQGEDTGVASQADKDLLEFARWGKVSVNRQYLLLLELR